MHFLVGPPIDSETQLIVNVAASASKQFAFFYNNVFLIYYCVHYFGNIWHLYCHYMYFFLFQQNAKSIFKERLFPTQDRELVEQNSSSNLRTKFERNVRSQELSSLFSFPLTELFTGWNLITPRLLLYHLMTPMTCKCYLLLPKITCINDPAYVKLHFLLVVSFHIVLR